jgi:single-stranded-DNA-specific exonuclease
MSKRDSLNGFQWIERSYDWKLKETIKQRFGLSEILSKAVSSRYKKLEGIEDYLNPSVARQIPEPFHLHDMEEAVKEIAKAVENKKKIGVFGDYDVDGATSTALLCRYLIDIDGPEVLFHIPDRIKDGYGPNEIALQDFKDKGVELCILLDCGTVAYAPLKFAKSIGLDVIVVDHHISSDILPEALAVINPNRYDQESDCGNLAAVGVTFLLVYALQRYLETEINYFEKNKIIKPDLRSYFDLVCLGTVCDVVPLTNFNRALVRVGLDVINSSKNHGVLGLIDQLGLSKRLDVYDLGFVIGPRINAGGRVGDASIGARLLMNKNPSQSYEMAKMLDELNDKRKLIEEMALKQASNMIEKMSEEKKRSHIMVFGDWHPGVSGLVASRLKDMHNLPTIAISFFQGDNIGKASCRSIHGLDIGSAILDARQKNLVLEGGGHAMAGGFSVDRSRLDALDGFFQSIFSSKIDGLDSHFFKEYDHEFESIKEINDYLYEGLKIVGPFGSGNPPMKFILRNLTVKNAKIFGSGNHVSCTLVKNGASIRCVSFGNVAHNPCMRLSENPRNISILGSIKANTFNGREFFDFIAEDMMIEDL